jgi:DNA-binding PadR family transcriptional regulator
MTLQYVLLGFLNYVPSTGYELKKLLDNSTQLFWHAELSQIYPILRKMEADGWVEAHVEPLKGRPDRKRYSITDTGRQAFRSWLSIPVDTIEPEKNEVLLKLFFSGSLDTATVLAHLRLQLELRRAYLQRLQGPTRMEVAALIQATGQHREGVFWELILDYGEEQTKTAITWLEGAIQRVAQLS